MNKMPQMGMGGGPQQIQIDMRNARDVTCSCGNLYFTSARRIKSVSAIVSPTGEEIIFPMEVLLCTSCGKEFNTQRVSEDRSTESELKSEPTPEEFDDNVTSITSGKLSDLDLV